MAINEKHKLSLMMALVNDELSELISKAFDELLGEWTSKST